MKYQLKVIVLFITLFTLKINGFAQSGDLSKTESINKYLKINKIKGVEVYDSDTNEKWILSNNNLKFLLKNLSKSKVTLNLIMPPTRYYIKFIGAQKFEGYETYMSNQYIYFDPGTPSPKNKQQFTIYLKKAVDWDKLR